MPSFVVSHKVFLSPTSIFERADVWVRSHGNGDIGNLLMWGNVPCPVHFLHVPAIGSFSHWVFNAPNEQFGFGLWNEYTASVRWKTDYSDSESDIELRATRDTNIKRKKLSGCVKIPCTAKAQMEGKLQNWKVTGIRIRISDRCIPEDNKTCHFWSRTFLVSTTFQLESRWSRPYFKSYNGIRQISKLNFMSFIILQLLMAIASAVLTV